jgi:conjugal transfer pilus assembly protein TraB
VSAALLKNLPGKRRQQLLTIGAVGGLFVIVLGGLLISDPHHRVDARTPAQKAANDVLRNYRTPGTAVDASTVWITTSEAKLKELAANNADLQHQVAELKGQLLSFEGRGTARANTPATTPLPGESTSAPAPAAATSATTAPATANDTSFGLHSRGPISMPKTPLPPLAGMRATGSPPPTIPSGILEVTLSSPPDATLSVSNAGSSSGLASSANGNASGGAISASAKAATGKEATATVKDTLVSGTIASAVLLTGFDAPTGGTAKTNPMPVVMRLLTHGTLPNHQSGRVRDCFATGAGYGDLSAERAYIRLEQLSCVMQDGSIIDNTIEGFVAGEDGKNGLRGKVVSKQGQMIGMALLAGFASGMGQSLSSSYSTVSTSPLGSTATVNPDQVFQSGAASGMGKALDKIADFYIQRANDLFPVVEIDSGRRGDILLTKPAKLGPAYAQAWTDRP